MQATHSSTNQQGFAPQLRFSAKRLKDMAVDSDSEGHSQASSKSSWPARKSKAIRKSKISSKVLPKLLKFKAVANAKRTPLNKLKSQPRSLQSKAFLYSPEAEGLNVFQIGKRASDLQQAEPVHEMDRSRVVDSLLVESVLNPVECLDQMGLHETNSRIKNFQHLLKTPSLSKDGQVDIEQLIEAGSNRQEDEDGLDDMLFSDEESEKPVLTLPMRNTTTEVEQMEGDDLMRPAEKEKRNGGEANSDFSNTTSSQISPVMALPSRPTIATQNIRQLFFMQELETPKFEESAQDTQHEDLDALLLDSRAPAMKQGLSTNWLLQEKEMSDDAADLAQCRSFFSKAFNLEDDKKESVHNNNLVDKKKFYAAPSQTPLEFTERRRSSASLFEDLIKPDQAKAEAAGSFTSGSFLMGETACLKKTTSLGKPEGECNNSTHQTHDTSVLNREGSNGWLMDRA